MRRLFALTTMQLLEEGLSRVEPKKDHMYTYVSVVFLAESIAPEVPKLIKKTRCHRDYRMSLYGWMDYRIAAYDCTSKRIYTNWAGRPLKQTLLSVTKKRRNTNERSCTSRSSVAILVAGYIFYGGWLAKQWGLGENKEETPAHTMEDGQDYVPAKAPVLMGHHFSSIAGAGPINGPIQAAVFGWIPVMLWVLIGGIFFGATHDFGALFASLRNKGQSNR